MPRVMPVGVYNNLARVNMIATHRSEPVEAPIRRPVPGVDGISGLIFSEPMGLEAIAWLLSSVVLICVNSSRCISLINSPADIVFVFMPLISSLPRFGAKFGIQDLDFARSVPYT